MADLTQDHEPVVVPLAEESRFARWNRGRFAWFAPGDAWILIGGGLAVIASIFGFWYFATGVSPDVWVPVMVFTGLCIVSVPWIVVHADKDRKLRKILLLALVLKLLFVFPRYLSNEILYEGNSDSGQYHNAGQVFYLNVHEGRGYTIDGSNIEGYSDETRVIGTITGYIYLVVGTSKVGGYLTLSWVSWVGLVMVYKAFRVAYPNAPPYLACWLIFFLPSMLYWPSSLGKDAIMVFCIGLLTLGVSRVVTPSGALRGVVYLVIAASLMLAVRPHLLLVGAVGVAVSMLASNRGSANRVAATFSRAILLVLLVPALLIGMSSMDQFFGETGDFSVTAALDQTTEQTSQGGSAFETSPVNNPLDFPIAILSVVYRPFPFEVRSVPVLISSMEGTLMLVFTLACARWIWRVGPAMRRNPFAAYCGGYVLAFVFAFSNVGNAGILARQRVQMFPILMALVACGYEVHRQHLESEARDDQREPGVHDVVPRPHTRLSPVP